MEDGIRVLLVEDNPGDARLVALTLEYDSAGPFQIEAAVRISEALQRLERPGIDVILLDRTLPDSKDWAGLIAVRKKAPRVPVVVLTGSVDPVLSYEAVESGAQDYHVKGVFVSGVLGRTLWSSIIRHRVEERLSQGRDLDSKLLEAVAQLPEGVAMLEGAAIVYVNPAFTQITGRRTAELTPVPEWMTRFTAAGKLPVAAGPGKGGGPSLDHGDFLLDRADGSTVDIEFVAKSFGTTTARRTFLWMRIVASIGGPSKDGEDPETARGEPPKGSARAPGPDSAAGHRSSKEATALDPDTWVGLRELAENSPEFLPTLVATFLSEGRTLLDQLAAASRSGDLDAVGRAAHTLASSSAQVGAFQLRELCGRLELSAGGRRDQKDVPELVTLANREFHLAEAALGELPGSG